MNLILIWTRPNAQLYCRYFNHVMKTPESIWGIFICVRLLVHPGPALLYLLPTLRRWYGLWRNLRQLQWAHLRECGRDSFLETIVWSGAENQCSGSGLTREGQWIEMTGCYGGGWTGEARRSSAPAWFKLKLNVVLTADSRVNSSFKPSSTRSLGCFPRQSSPSFTLSVVLAWCRAELMLQRQHRCECIKVSQGGRHCSHLWPLTSWRLCIGPW